jgi:hypothetical protein
LLAPFVSPVSFPRGNDDRQTLEFVCSLRSSLPAGNTIALCIEDANFRTLSRLPMTIIDPDTAKDRCSAANAAVPAGFAGPTVAERDIGNVGRSSGRRAMIRFSRPYECRSFAHLAVERIHNGQVVERQLGYMGVPRQARRDTYEWLMAPGGADSGKDARFAELGIDSLLRPPLFMGEEQTAKHLAMLNLRQFLYVHRIWRVDQNPDFWAYADNVMFRNLDAYAPYGLVYANLGDDTTIEGFSDKDIRYRHGFVEFLEKRHGDLATLNRRWKSNYQCWTDVPVLTPQQISHGCPESPSLTLETRRYLQEYLASTVERLGQRAKQHLSDPVCGFDSCLSRSCASIDWEQVGPGLEMVGTYPEDWICELPAFAKKDAVLGNFIGSYEDFPRTPYHLLQRQWYLLLNDYNAAYHWLALGFVNDWPTAPYPSLMCPDGRLQRGYRETVQLVRRLKDGLFAQVYRARPHRDAIGILYNFDSVLLTHDAVNRTFGETEDSVRGFWSLLEECGYTPHLVAHSQLRTSAVESLDCRVLILPYSKSLTREDRLALRRFVDSGGMLIADVRPGAFDEFGAPVASDDPISDLFGVDFARTKEKRVSGNVSVFGKHAVGIPAACADACVTLKSSAEAGGTLGTIPVLIQHSVGKGRTLLLNFLVSNYLAPKAFPTQKTVYYRSGTVGDRAAAMRTLFRGILTRQGLTPTVEVVSNGQLIPAVRRVYRRDDATYVVVLRGPALGYGGERQITLKLPSSQHVYDTLSGEYLGKTDKVTRVVEPFGAVYLTLLPYRVTDVQVAPIEPVQRGQLAEFTVELKTDGTVPGSHEMTFARRAPDGTILPLDHAIVSVSHGRGKVSAWIGPNDASGLWQYIVTDVGTQQAGQCTVRLTPMN